MLIHLPAHIAVPMLLSSLRDITYLAFRRVSIVVNVNERSLCNNVDELTITAIVIEGTRDLATQETVEFADTVITFEFISPGDYTCSVRVEDETGPIEMLQIPCGMLGKNDIRSLAS